MKDFFLFLFLVSNDLSRQAKQAANREDKPSEHTHAGFRTPHPMDLGIKILNGLAGSDLETTWK